MTEIETYVYKELMKFKGDKKVLSELQTTYNLTLQEAQQLVKEMRHRIASEFTDTI
jgi:hypothetical protein